MLSHEKVQRRLKPRIDGPIPAIVRATDAGGQPFEIEVRLDNLRVGGLHVCLDRRLEAGALLSALIRLSGISIETSGVVRRVEAFPDGSFGLGVEFAGYGSFSSVQVTGMGGS